MLGRLQHFRSYLRGQQPSTHGSEVLFFGFCPFLGAHQDFVEEKQDFVDATIFIEFFPRPSLLSIKSETSSRSSTQFSYAEAPPHYFCPEAETSNNFGGVVEAPRQVS